MPDEPEWTASGGSIDADGWFAAPSGVWACAINARVGQITATPQVKVVDATATPGQDKGP
ncbi:MAG: hypothetical protein HY675_22375 [Chloroflexi bacterium]|nr:hypothetical protein [Chloroflexota bacterium]